MSEQPEEKLKSASSELYSIDVCIREIEDTRQELSDTIKQIQLNAYRAGMRRAAEDVKEYRECMVDTVGRMALSFEAQRLLTLSQTITTEGMK
jgi:hypothetical protein